MPFDALSTFVVFLIGVPALVIQSMDPEVRRAVMKHPLALLLRAGAPLVLALALIVAASAFILLTRPGESSVASPPNLPSPASSAPSLADRIVEAMDQQLVSAQQDQMEQASRERIWAGVIGLLTLLTVFAAIYIPAQYGQRDRIVASLERQVTRGSKEPVRLQEETLTTLIELGEQSQAGEDKQMVLEALGALARRERQHANYRGDSLEMLIDGLKNIIAADSQPGDAKNFRTAIGILQEIVMTPPTTREPRSTDLFYATRALSELSRAALAHINQPSEIEHLLIVCTASLKSATEIYPTATTEVSQALLEIGVAAMAKQQTLAATAALDALLLLVESNQPASGELVADTLGLASHFWVDGDTARKYVEAKLASTKGDLEQTWRKALEAAREHCARTMQFETADNLSKMIASLRKM